MPTITFRRIAAGSYVNEASGVEIHQGESSGRWFVYTVVPGHQIANLAATGATLAQAKIAAKAVIAGLAARREADHVEALEMNATAQPVKFRKVAAGRYVHDETGVELNRVDSYREHGYNVGPRWRISAPMIDGWYVAGIARTMATAQRWATESGGIVMRRRAAIADAYAEALGYDAYRTELRTELGKFARGEEPYPYESQPTAALTGGTDWPTAWDGRGNVIVPGARKYVSRSCCASTEGDVHDRSCQTDEARREWAPRSAR